MTIANVTLTTTFDQWRIRTNQIISKLDEVEGNVANSLANNNANIASTIVKLQSNVANILGTANAVYTYAANTVMLAANSAFAVANSANLIPVGNTMANGYWTIRSTKRRLNFVPGQNISIDVEDNTILNTANIIISANTNDPIDAHNKANLAYTFAANNSILAANSAYNKANSANILAFKANENAAAAFAFANVINVISISAFNMANLQPSLGTANSYEFRLGTSANHTLTPASVWDTNATLIDESTIVVDFSKGFDFSGSGNAPLSLSGNRTLGFPSNLKQGQKGILWFSASGSTRTLTLNASYKIMEGVETGPYSIATNSLIGIAYVVNNGNVYITSVLRRTSI